MKKVVVAGVLVVLMLGLLSAAAFTAPPPQTNTVTVSATVPSAAWLNVVDGTAALSGAPDDVVTDNVEFTVKANWDWTLQADALSDLSGTETVNNVATVTIPASRVKVGAGEASADGNVTVATGNKTAGQTVTVPYKLSILWTDAPATYTATHTYTLAFQ